MSPPLSPPSELEKISLPGPDVYLPTDPRKLVRSIVTDSGIPLQSAKKVPIMVSFMVVEREGEEEDDPVDEASLHRQACIFKVSHQPLTQSSDLARILFPRVF